MKAVRIHDFGGPEVLKYEDVPNPEPQAGEVLVRVHAAGVNPVDWKIRGGYMREKITLPLILGWDVSGTVERVGAGVTDFVVGDEVYSRPDIGRNGAYAEYIVIRANEVAKKPKSLDHLHAAAVPLAALTAWQALFNPTAINLTKGQTLLIHGGAGGVGTFAVQFAKWKGARVITTGSAANEQFLRELGAAEVVDYKKSRFEDVARNADAVLDTIGGDTQARSWGVLKPGGVLTSIVASADPPADAKSRNIRGTFVFVQPNASQLVEIARLIDEKIVHPVLAEVFPLTEVKKAHALSQTGHVRGKIVLKV